MIKLKPWLLDRAYQFLLTSPNYKWLAGTGTYDNPLGPVNPRSEESYKQAIKQHQANLDMMHEQLSFSYQTIAELREEQRQLRAIIDRQDRIKHVKENFR